MDSQASAGGFVDQLVEMLSNPTFTVLGIVLLTAAVVLMAIRVAQFAASALLKDSARRYHSRKLVAFFGYLIFFVVLLVIFGDQLGNVTIALGVAGAGIAFALQEVIASVAGWLAISAAGFFKPGDRVQLGGIKGDVIDIGVLRTTLMEIGDWVSSDLYNGRIVRVANSFVFKEPVFNYSGEFPFLWDEFKIPIHYESDLVLAESIIETAVVGTVADFTASSKAKWSKFRKHYLVADPQIQPMITLELTDSWVAFTARYIVDYRARRRTRDKIMRQIIKAIGESGGKVRIASSTTEILLKQADGGAPPPT